MSVFDLSDSKNLFNLWGLPKGRVVNEKATFRWLFTYKTVEF